MASNNEMPEAGPSGNASTSSGAQEVTGSLNLAQPSGAIGNSDTIEDGMAGTSGGSANDVSVVGTPQDPAFWITDPQERNAVQTKLTMLYHAKSCDGSSNCHLRNCQLMKKVLQHLRVCRKGMTCPEPHCTSSRQIIRHWNHCRNQECYLCSPVRARSIADLPPLPVVPMELTTDAPFYVWASRPNDEDEDLSQTQFGLCSYGGLREF